MRDTVVKYILHNQILAAILVVATVWLMILVREVLVALFISYILMAAITPYVDLLKKRGIPKPIAIIIPFAIAIAGLALILIALLPFFISQVTLLLSRLPSYLNQDFAFLGINIESEQIGKLASNELSNIGGNAIGITSRLFGGIVSIISVFAISFYLLLYREEFKKNISSVFPTNHQEKVANTLHRIEEKLGSWLRGQLVLSTFIGVLTWIALTVLGIDYALPLAIIAGIFALIPTIGPILSSVPAIIVALNISPFLAVMVAASYFIIQLIESNILLPRVMGKAVGLNPIIIIIGIIIGGKLLGIPGALLAIPFISLVTVAYKNLE